jgi:DNA-binding GntR family transcriptional regulator
MVAPPLRPPKRTRAEELRLHLADEIVRGVLEPGTLLDETALAQRFGVSRTPVREALRELAASGLVQTRPRRGAEVARPTPAQLESMFAAMAELEALCAGLCAVHMAPAERRGLQAVHEALRDLTRDGDPQRYHEGNETFHQAIYLGTHNPYLAEITLATRRRVAPFRRAQFRTIGRLALSYEEHDRVVQCIMRGDRAGAAAAMHVHISLVHFTYERYAEERRPRRALSGAERP